MRLAPNTAADRVTARYVPTGSTEQRHDDAQAVVYSYTSVRGVPYAIGYAGTAYRSSFHHRFADEARRARFVSDWLEAQRARVARRQVRQAEQKASTHELQCGDIVYSSWGYEQTNVDFFQVVQVVSAKSVKLRQVSQKTVETGFMCGTTRPLKDQFCEDAATLLCRAEGTSIRNVGGRYKRSAAKWDGRDVACSWYA